MERTVAMTGMKFEELLASIGGVGISQGGPFVAGDYTGDFDGDAELEIALSLLDLRLSRWSALQRVMRTLPLTVPLDQYQLSSGFGSRTDRSEEHTSELQSLMRISYAVFCLKKKNKHNIKQEASSEETSMNKKTT